MKILVIFHAFAQKPPLGRICINLVLE